MVALSLEGISSCPALPRTTRSSSPIPPQPPLPPPPPLLPLPPRTRHNPAHHFTSKLLRISRFRTVLVTKGEPVVHPQFSWLLTRCLPKPFRMRTSIKCACNSFRMNTSKKTGRGGLVAQASACGLRSRPLAHPEPRRACPPRRATAALLTTHPFLVSRLCRYSNREP